MPVFPRFYDIHRINQHLSHSFPPTRDNIHIASDLSRLSNHFQRKSFIIKLEEDKTSQPASHGQSTSASI